MTYNPARPIRRMAPLALVLVPILAGCTEPDTSPLPNTLPTTSAAPSSDRPLPSAAGRWTGLASRCPRLSSGAATTLGVAGEGQPTSDYQTNGETVTADCQWGSTDGNGAGVKVRMTIYPAQPAADAAWRVLSAGQTEAVSGIGDEAFSTLEPPNVTVRTRSNNVVATIRLLTPPASTTADRLKELQPTAATIAQDALDDLR